MSLKILVGCLEKLFFRLTLNIGGGGGETDLKTFKMELVVLFWVFYLFLPLLLRYIKKAVLC